MSPGDRVVVSVNKAAGTVLKVPTSLGRKRPRALVKLDDGNEVWVHQDELVAAQPESSQ